MSEEFKYLRIKGIEDYQAEFMELERGRYIKDAPEKDSSPEYVPLTYAQRYLLDALRRLWALHRQNPLNDSSWIARATCAGRSDATRVPLIVRSLCAHGLLIPCNEKDSFAIPSKIKERKVREVKDNDPPSPSENPLSDIDDPEMKTPETPAVSRTSTNPGPVVSMTTRDPKPGEHAQWLTVFFWELLGRPRRVSGADQKNYWEPRMKQLLAKYEFAELRDAIRWAVKEDSFWPQVITSIDKLVKNIEKIVELYQGAKRGKENYERAQAQKDSAVSDRKKAPANYGSAGLATKLTGTVEL